MNNLDEYLGVDPLLSPAPPLITDIYDPFSNIPPAPVVPPPKKTSNLIIIIIIIVAITLIIVLFSFFRNTTRTTTQQQQQQIVTSTIATQTSINGTTTRTSTSTGTGTATGTSVIFPTSTTTSTVPPPVVSIPLDVDFIIVGGGTAGAVMAKRLTDNGQFKVLVLEAGGFNDCDTPIRVSTVAPMLQSNYGAQYFWQDQESIPQPQAGNRTFQYTGGKLMGGSSSINGQQFVRATPDVLREWQASIGGMDPDWSVERLEMIYRDLEQYQGETSNAFTRGVKGEVHVRQAPQQPTTLSQQITTAITNVTRVPEIVDYNDPMTPIGCFNQWQLTQYPSGLRESSSTAYIRPNVTVGGVDAIGIGTRQRPLTVWTNIHVRRVLFDGTRAFGVEYVRETAPGVFSPLPLQLLARRGVIVSAGIHSPTLLLRSGIGPAADLQAVQVHVVVDNPNVGKNLSNHTLLIMNSTINTQVAADTANDANALYTSGAFLPDLTLPGNSRGLQLITTRAFAPAGSLTWILIPVKPFSRGSIRLISNDPTVAPEIDFGYLRDARDVTSLKSMVNQVAAVIQNLGQTDSAIQLTNPTREMINEDVQLEAYIRGTLAQNHHWVGSCKMATRDQNGVVDSAGRVYGTQQLWVCDASVMPLPNSGNTSSIAYLVGNVLAEKLLRELNPNGSVLVSNQNPCI